MLRQKKQRPTEGMSGRQMCGCEKQRRMARQLIVRKLTLRLLNLKQQTEYIDAIML